MFKISHRGNLDGPNSSIENCPKHIMALIRQGMQVEVDVRCSDDGKTLFLGHDYAQHMVPASFLLSPGLWCHAKDAHALVRLAELNAHYFWHDTDDVVLTSNRIHWVHPKVDLSKFPIEFIKRAILVKPETSPTPQHLRDQCLGVCTDYMG